VVPNKHEFITGGQDKLLIKWDGDKRKVVVKKKLEYSIKSLDVSGKGMLAVGHSNGVVGFYDCGKLDYIKKIQTFKNPDKEVVSVVKFSPNGNVIGVGYCPPVSQVYLYNVDTLSKIGICKGSPSRILSIDFTRDGNSIIINNTSYEILFYNANNGTQITTATSFKN
jgi:microtubule-associated protein-like 6